MTNKLLGICILLGGAVLILFALGELLVRLSVACVGLWLINYGLKMYGSGSLYTRVYNWYLFRKF
jgi:hypothetical protein